MAECLFASRDPTKSRRTVVRGLFQDMVGMSDPGAADLSFRGIDVKGGKIILPQELAGGGKEGMAKLMDLTGL
jgi:hypothetical protein